MNNQDTFFDASMPIVDDESHLHDDELTSKFQNHFSMSGNGRIIDSAVIIGTLFKKMNY